MPPRRSPPRWREYAGCATSSAFPREIQRQPRRGDAGPVDGDRRRVRALGPTQLRRARARVDGQFRRARQDRLSGPDQEARRRDRRLARQLPRGCPTASGTAREELLDNTVLERMKRDDDEPTAGDQRAFGGRQTPQQLAEFVVDRDAQGLKDLGRGMLQFPRPRRRNARDHPRELQGRHIRRTWAIDDDGPCDPTRGALLAEMVENVG